MPSLSSARPLGVQRVALLLALAAFLSALGAIGVWLARGTPAAAFGQASPMVAGALGVHGAAAGAGIYLAMSRRTLTAWLLILGVAVAGIVLGFAYAFTGEAAAALILFTLHGVVIAECIAPTVRGWFHAETKEKYGRRSRPT